MTSRIPHHGLDAIRKFHNGTRVWLIRSREKDHGYARQESTHLWLFWTSLEAMDAGDFRVYHQAPKLEAIMGRIAGSESGLKQVIKLNRSNKMEDDAKSKDAILQAMNDYIDGTASDREHAIQTIDVIGQQNPELRTFADDAITTVLFRSFDNAA